MKKGLHVCTRSCEILAKIKFSSQIFEIFAQISNFMTIGQVGSKLIHADEQRERHDEANNRFSQFYERAQQYNI
jgi:hypothetical protein